MKDGIEVIKYLWGMGTPCCSPSAAEPQVIMFQSGSQKIPNLEPECPSSGNAAAEVC